VSTDAAGALIGAAVCLLAAPYLARLTHSVPDKERRQWWVGANASRNRTALTAGVGIVFGGLAGAAAGATALLPAFVFLALMSTPLAIIDYETQRLPDRLVFPAAVGGAVLLTVAAAVDDAWHPLLRAAEGAAAVLAALFALVLISPRGFGLGDVKIGGVLGGYLGWFGWKDVYYGIFAGFLLGALVAIVMLITRRGTLKTAIPFGPMLMLGPVLVLAFDLAPG
jgi:leader peptidase (prepilin peptidase)/N-methyltransferase